MTPIARFTIGFVTGLALGLRFGDPRLVLLAAVAGTVGVGLSRLSPPRGWITALGIAVGTIHGSVAAVGAREDCRARLADGARIEAHVHFHATPVAGRAVAGTLESVSVAGRVVACARTVRVRLPGELSSGTAHARVTGTWWSSPAEGRWPTPAERRGVLAARTVDPDSAGHRHTLAELRLAAMGTAGVVFERERPLAESMLLAHRDDLDPDLRQSFAAAGIAHVLAISGAHVGILAAALVLVMRLAGADARASATGAALGTLGYVLFLGAPPAASRAALQVLLLLAARAAQRPADPLSLMAAAAVALLVARPLSLLQPGFQLSFAGVFGLIAFSQPLGVLVPRALPRMLRQGVAASLAASLATAPIVAWHFGMVSLIGPLTNLVAAPLVALALPASALALAVGAASPWAGAFLGGGASLFLTGLRRVAEIAARPEWGHVWVTPFGVTAGLAGVGFALRFGPAPGVPMGLGPDARRRALRSRHLFRAAVAAATATVILTLGPVRRSALEIHAIDVGQGDALAVRTPRGRWILIDAGPRFGGFDAGRQRVAPYLLERGVRRIDVLILTHPDADHVGGAQWLWHAFDIRAVIDPAVPAGKDIYLDVVRTAQDRGTPWFAARAGRELRIDGVEFRILAPADTFLDRRPDANDLSAVVHLAYGSFGALFLGDAPRSVENAIVGRFGSGVRSELIKVGHHGSRTSTGDSLLDAARPAVALLSVGRRNRYGHPAPDVIKRLADHRVQVLRTDRGGSIEIQVRLDGSMEVRRRP